MGLSMQHKKEGTWPVLTCDKCGKPIGDWSLAVVAYNWPSEDSIVAVKVYHKGECDPGRGKAGAVLWKELKSYLPWLLWHNKWGRKGTNEKGATLTLNVPKPLDI